MAIDINKAQLEEWIERAESGDAGYAAKLLRAFCGTVEAAPIGIAPEFEEELARYFAKCIQRYLDAKSILAKLRDPSQPATLDSAFHIAAIGRGKKATATAKAERLIIGCQVDSWRRKFGKLEAAFSEAMREYKLPRETIRDHYKEWKKLVKQASAGASSYKK